MDRMTNKELHRIFNEKIKDNGQEGIYFSDVSYEEIIAYYMKEKRMPPIDASIQAIYILCNKKDKIDSRNNDAIMKFIVGNVTINIDDIKQKIFNQVRPLIAKVIANYYFNPNIEEALKISGLEFIILLVMDIISDIKVLSSEQMKKLCDILLLIKKNKRGKRIKIDRFLEVVGGDSIDEAIAPYNKILKCEGNCVCIIDENDLYTSALRRR